MIDAQLALPAYGFVLKAGHTFNLLDARGAISVTERAAYIGRIRALSRLVAQAYYDSREARLPDARQPAGRAGPHHRRPGRRTAGVGAAAQVERKIDQD